MTSFTLKLSSSTSWPTYWYSARHRGPCVRGWGLGRPTPGTGRCPTLRFLCMLWVWGQLSQPWTLPHAAPHPVHLLGLSSFPAYPAAPWSGTLRNSVLCSEGGRARGRLLALRAEDGGPWGGRCEPPPDVISMGRGPLLAEGGTPLGSRPGAGTKMGSFLGDVKRIGGKPWLKFAV